MLKPFKLYIKYINHSTHQHLYVPTYKGLELLLQQFPLPIKWEYERASDAQAHAERHTLRKKAQEKRFTDQDYQKKILVRYAAMVKKILLETYGAAEEKDEEK